MKVLCATFLLVQFGFVIFWHKNIGIKVVRKMLVKLTNSMRILFHLSVKLWSSLDWPDPNVCPFDDLRCHTRFQNVFTVCSWVFKFDITVWDCVATGFFLYSTKIYVQSILIDTNSTIPRFSIAITWRFAAAFCVFNRSFSIHWKQQC